MDEKEITHIVVTTTGTRLSGHKSEEEANAACKRANDDAAGLGLETRYEVFEKTG